MPFYRALEKEIASSELEGNSVIIAMDANAKLGPRLIPNDPKNMSRNGKVLAAVMERHALTVVNGMKDKCTGVITREMSTTRGIERSVMDVVIVSNNLMEHIEYMNIDDKRVHVLTKNTKTNATCVNIKSDHNIIETIMNLRWAPNEKSDSLQV